MTSSQIVVVADTTPLITLAGTSEIRLLPLLFGTVHIPKQVWNEYEKFRPQMDLPDISQLLWLQHHSVMKHMIVLPLRIFFQISRADY